MLGDIHPCRIYIESVPVYEEAFHRTVISEASAVQRSILLVAEDDA